MTAPAPAAAGRNRTMMILLGVLGAILVGYLLLKVVGGGGDDSASTTTTTFRSTVTTRRATTTTTAPGAAETFEVFTTKNPFIPLKGATTGGTSTGGTTGGTAGGTTGGTSTGGTSTGGTSTGGTSTGGTSGGGTSGGTSGSGGSTAPSTSQRVSLLDVFSESGTVKANVRVNNTVYKVVAGQTFASDFKAVSLSQSDGCGRFLFGDDQFRLCEGEQVVK